VPDTVDSLLCELLTWLGQTERPYAEVMDAWRTSCPRLPVWEDANDRGFVAQRHVAGQEPLVELTPLGREFLERSGRVRTPARTS